MYPSICLSIVSHGHGSMFGSLLAAIADCRLLDPTRDQVIVTLNLSEDEAFLQNGSSLPITVLRNPLPKGFGANHNSAFQVCRSDLFCVLNPDVHMDSFNLNFMRDILSDPSVGAWAPRVNSPVMTTEDSARKFPTPLILFKRYFLGRRSLDYFQSNLPIEVDWVAGMFVAFRRDVFASIRGFDESYHMYMEDVDICRRLKRASLKVIYDPRSIVIHDAQRDSRRKLKYLAWHFISACRYFLNVGSTSAVAKRSRIN